MLPTERRQVGEQMVGHIPGPSKGRHGALEESRVPQDNGGDEQVETGRTVLLVLVGAIADFPEPMDEDCAGQTVARFALVQLLAGFAAVTVPVRIEATTRRISDQCARMRATLTRLVIIGSSVG